MFDDQDDLIILYIDNTKPVLIKVLSIVGLHKRNCHRKNSASLGHRLQRYILSNAKCDYKSCGDIEQYNCLMEAISDMQEVYGYFADQYWGKLAAYYQQKYEDIALCV